MNLFDVLMEMKDVYISIRWRKFSVSVKTGKKKEAKKINFINLFGYEKEKIIF